MLSSNIEYIPLRLLRRYVFSDALLLRFGSCFPYYLTNNNQVNPAPLVDNYVRIMKAEKSSIDGNRLLEIGVGRTNSTCYEMAARFPTSSFISFEPYVPFGKNADAKLLQQIANNHHSDPALIAKRVRRITHLENLADNSVDFVLSSSVLEHVSDPLSLFNELRRVMIPGGVMLHFVDYRDHFFKYPFHFLQFRKDTWNRWFNPGDLPVWRAYDHVEQLVSTGFSVRLIEEAQNPEGYQAIAPYISEDYRLDDNRLQTISAVIWATPSPRK